MMKHSAMSDHCNERHTESRSTADTNYTVVSLEILIITIINDINNNINNNHNHRQPYNDHVD